MFNKLHYRVYDSKMEGKMNRIEVTEQVLTDGSKVYNVDISAMTLHADSQRSAETIAEVLKKLIDVSTVDQVAIKFDY